MHHVFGGDIVADKLKDLALWLLSWAFTFFSTNVTDSVNILKDGIPDSAWNQATGLASSLNVATSVILCMCATIEMAICFAKIDSMRMETGIKIAVKFTLTKVFCEQAPALLGAIYSQTQSWVGLFGDVAGTGTNLKNLTDKVKEYSSGAFGTFSGLGTSIGMFLVVIIVLLAIVACGLLIKVMAYARIFEVLAYVVVSPLPMAFLPLTGSLDIGVNNITKRFFKSYIGACMQAVVMLVCIKVYDAVVCAALYSTYQTVAFDATATQREIITQFSDMLWAMALCSVALVVAVSKSGSWAKSMVDGA